MELAEKISELKNSLGKYSKSRLLHLAEAAKELKVTEKYLAELARRGKVKAFRVGEHWFLEEKWLNDFRGVMKGLLGEEVAGADEVRQPSANWVRSLPLRKRLWPAFNFRQALVLVSQTAVAAVILSLVGLGFGLLCLPLASVGLNRDSIAVNFLAATYRAYGAPAAVAGRLAVDLPINDEDLTISLYNLAGRVAGAYEAGPAE
ncbi:MAG: hypothetical protein WC517_05170 [Patescibacteria group bacterium]